MSQQVMVYLFCNYYPLLVVKVLKNVFSFVVCDVSRFFFVLVQMYKRLLSNVYYYLCFPKY